MGLESVLGLLICPAVLGNCVVALSVLILLLDLLPRELARGSILVGSDDPDGGECFFLTVKVIQFPRKYKNTFTMLHDGFDRIVFQSWIDRNGDMSAHHDCQIRHNPEIAVFRKQGNLPLDNGLVDLRFEGVHTHEFNAIDIWGVRIGIIRSSSGFGGGLGNAAELLKQNF